MLMPLLSEADPKVSAEGSIDPLGMYAIADSLAVRMIPGVRERQTHPRFLTSIAVSLSLCSDFPEETVAADGISEPWQVFEWYLVEGMVRTTKESVLLRGLPGQNKARRARKDKVPLSEKRYLKTPTVFGFHGVYRGLARDMEIERADRLGEVGYELVSTWEKEQGLTGYSGTNEGHGKAVRRQLLDAVRDGIQRGAVARDGWAGWQFFSDHLGIYGSGKRESRVIAQALLNPASGFRKEVLGCLIGPDGKKLWRGEREAKSASERRFHELLITGASHELRQLLEAISIYEDFCRLLQDAFDDCLCRLSQDQRRIQPSELAGLVGVKQAAKRVPEIFGEVSERLSLFGDKVRFQEAFSSLAERLPPVDWVERLMKHHCEIQRGKPPEGKAPWFDRFDDGSCMIRTGYVRKTGGRHDDNYVHAYRTKSLWSFARDLGLVK
ncbi:MAG: hypothetical protein KDA55_08450 [Planctomycetales bacterium]|nr:hypothetical protein [Planctomycetales bacterium]